MDYQTFVERLNSKELISKIEKALECNVNIFLDVEEDSSVTNRFNVKITIVTEKMDRFFNSEEVYLFKVDLDHEDVYENAQVSIPIDNDQVLRLVKMNKVIDQVSFYDTLLRLILKKVQDLYFFLYASSRL